jgi:hypothetical protein
LENVIISYWTHKKYDFEKVSILVKSQPFLCKHSLFQNVNTNHSHVMFLSHCSPCCLQKSIMTWPPCLRQKSKPPSGLIILDFTAKKKSGNASLFLRFKEKDFVKSSGFDCLLTLASFVAYFYTY